MGLELQGRRALVTGASGGIGEAIVRALHAKGATVVITARRKEILEALAADLGDRVEVVKADLSDRASVEALIGRAGEHRRARGERRRYRPPVSTTPSPPRRSIAHSR